MFLSTLGAIHMGAAVAAMGLGSIVMLDPKGTPTHRLLGVGFAIAMVVVNITALSLYRMTGQFGPFHVLALFSLLSLVRSLLPLINRRHEWLRVHYRYMIISYGGLLAAAVTETLTRVPGLRVYINSAERVFALGFVIALAMVIVVRVVMPRFEQRTLRLAVANMRAEALSHQA